MCVCECEQEEEVAKEKSARDFEKRKNRALDFASERGVIDAVRTCVCVCVHVFVCVCIVLEMFGNRRANRYF
ncbi:MAG: hypothetical protein P4L40_23045 [Terracidiphilus sp.]|nr:hypothetical protein [Terracidiphilus sp.]